MERWPDESIFSFSDESVALKTDSLLVRINLESATRSSFLVL